MTKSATELEALARELRARIVAFSSRTGTPHLGSCLSCLDILTALYFNIPRVDPENPYDDRRDRFILSKGHGAPALFQVLAMRGFFPESDLLESDHDGSGTRGTCRFPGSAGWDAVTRTEAMARDFYGDPAGSEAVPGR